MTTPLTIYADSQEKRPLPFRFEGVDLKRRRLDVCDYAWDGDCIPIHGKLTVRVMYGWERKSVADFVSSWCIFGNRQRELAKLGRAKDCGFIPPIVLVGSLAQWFLDHGGRLENGMYVTRAGVEYWIRRLGEMRVQIVRCATPTEAAQFIVDAVRRRCEGVSPCNT